MLTEGFVSMANCLLNSEIIIETNITSNLVVALLSFLTDLNETDYNSTQI